MRSLGGNRIEAAFGRAGKRSRPPVGRRPGPVAAAVRPELQLDRRRSAAGHPSTRTDAPSSRAAADQVQDPRHRRRRPPRRKSARFGARRPARSAIPRPRQYGRIRPSPKDRRDRPCGGSKRIGAPPADRRASAASRFVRRRLRLAWPRCRGWGAFHRRGRSPKWPWPRRRTRSGPANRPFRGRSRSCRRGRCGCTRAPGRRPHPAPSRPRDDRRRRPPTPPRDRTPRAHRIRPANPIDAGVRTAARRTARSP